MHPILFKIGSFTIGTYGVMIVIGLLTGLWLTSRLARRRNLKPDFFYDLAFVLLLSGFIGARLLFILTEWEEFKADPLAMIFSRGGFVFLGGFGAALVAGLWFTRHRRMPLFEVTDAVAPGLVLAHAFGRIGCFFAGCCYGFACPADNAHSALAKKLAVQYPLISEHGQPAQMFNFAYWGQIQQGLIGPLAPAPLPILPVQLFESAGNFLICLILLWQWRRRRFSGQTFALYMGLYSILRFSLEMLRGDEDRGVYALLGLNISTSQIICLATLVAAIVLWVTRRNKGFEPIQPEASLETPAQPPLAAPALAPAAAAKASRPARKRR